MAEVILGSAPDVHGASRGPRTPRAHRGGRSVGELAIGVGTAEPRPGPVGDGTDFTDHGWVTPLGLGEMAGLNSPAIAGTYPVPDAALSPATQTYESTGITYPDAGWPGAVGFAPGDIDLGLAVLNEMRVAVSVPVRNDTFGGTAPDHRLYATVNLNGFEFDFYGDEYDAWAAFGALNWQKSITVDPDVAAALWDGLKDGVSWPFSVELDYWTQWKDVRGTVSSPRPIAVPHWRTNQTGDAFTDNSVTIAYDVTVFDSAGREKVASSGIALEGHSRGSR